MPSVIRRALVAALLGLFALPVSAFATWSIIVLDRATGRIGVAGASCTSDVYGVMALVPGTGALMAQANGHPTAMREAIRLLRAGITPDSILRIITAPGLDSAVQHRQYAIATFASGQTQYTGSALIDYRGERSTDGVLVQGSILAGPAVLDRAMEAILQTRAAGGSLEEVVMAGLKAGAAAGGDSRCGARRASSAFLAVAKPGDIPNWPYLTLRVVEAGNVNAVELLDARLAQWQATGRGKFRVTFETVRPDSTDQPP